MGVKSFLKLVEIQTKVASIIPFILGTVYTLYRYDDFNVKNFLFMYISLIAFDMATTAINNYIDYKKAIKKHGFGYEVHNAIANFNLKEGTVVFTIFILVLVAVAMGLILFINTNYILLILGIISFGVGILYSFGPVPISRMPLGEIFSGFFMGFIIPFVSIYIHRYNKGLIDMNINLSQLIVKFDFLEVIIIFLISLPAIVGISNIMLANNICDIEDDIENKRYTLPIYIGKEKSLKLFKYLYYIAYINIILSIIFKILPITTILVLFTLIPIKKNIDVFFKEQTKKNTFIFAVKNFVIINSIYILSILPGLLLK
ncbi:1,4-dihydroxy-2-naphthoate polyprenyltransferase [Senegalia massiliensis]|uniref:1,4-dihydroxy-2-naphthoate polyprenyltransferase n=1 Tax=Senegalia massiliensis TaxID=1720316 RepID=A0A845QXB1_9CLOT|nr:1,4-dihydroxy-2-naphthoate polyprenyltransferase [Senegalia massiliensis]NBI06409.1 1,4-dihydroxy-2-naphthoate polyprenyltransferase [Senegalia massiliensis]